ncbi:hypothetical protein F8M41_000169 [Gigaspora margarita]|uniref:Uncharacterized protein n=1 Tax=Gigaspora margarita TaxID=4874 RepID=A0A8H4A8U6_GIGMA|nr:hypothetical protein F8M41_000169 [Gigaspora margarita]
MKSKLSNPTDSDISLYDALKNNLQSYFLEPRDNMKCDLLESIASRCKKFVDDFNKSGDTHTQKYCP